MSKMEGGGTAPYSKYNKSPFLYSEVEEITRARREGRDEEADRLGEKHTAKHLRTRRS